MRKLVTIRTISQLLPIPNKDRICLAIIDGWSVIVKKEEFNVGDKCLFFEIDSFLPFTDTFSFLGKPIIYKGKPGYRLKTMKMAGALSQGLALPLHMFPTITDTSLDDYTEQLGVIKYDVAEVVSFQSPASTGPQEGKFPVFIPKTDQERIQNLTHYFDTHKHHEFEETLKLDGSSMTCYKIPKQPSIIDRIKTWFGIKTTTYHFGVCSRNFELKPSESNFWKAARKYNIEKRLPIGYAIQGELLAPNIQSNHEKVNDVEYHIFDVYNIKEQRYLLPSERRAFVHLFLTTPHVPVVSTAVRIFEQHDLQSLLKHVEGQSINPNTISEGRVYKSTTNPSLTFKAISNQYLLKSEI